MEELLMETLKDKKKLIMFLMKVIEESKKEQDGLVYLAKSLTREDPNLDLKNIAKCLLTTMIVSAKQSHYIQNLATIALIQCSSDSFDTDVAMVMNKMGMGQEALQQMMMNKFK